MSFVLVEAESNANNPCLILERNLSDECGAAPGEAVGKPARSLDDENEKHIANCGHLSLLAYAAYSAFGCEDDRAEANRWRVLRDEAVKARSPAQVRRMELARGLA